MEPARGDAHQIQAHEESTGPRKSMGSGAEQIRGSRLRVQTREVGNREMAKVGPSPVFLAAGPPNATSLPGMTQLRSPFSTDS